MNPLLFSQSVCFQDQDQAVQYLKGPSDDDLNVIAIFLFQKPLLFYFFLGRNEANSREAAENSLACLIGMKNK